jgi:hypothetical protein
MDKRGEKQKAENPVRRIFKLAQAAPDANGA